jgi:hypothetical protein
MNYIYIVRKPPCHPYGYPEHIQAFTIAKVCKTRADAMQFCNDKQKRSTYLFTVQRIPTEVK